MQIETVWIVLAVILVLIELWAINRVRKSEGKSSNKGVWIVLIVFVPLFGLIAWALAGPKHIGHGSASQANR
ncbi:MAG TPA: PLD nuclease N-terminal domain-containing protein [Pseudomonas sp.]|uniref:PLD nuclease N-terminal domain-containing protein n=1 Tax=Pseudomonas sp. TaxID=306 RepID=UPI002C2BEFFA|nr:PLD nuclease N-terminal domain-containing protein [Pseudomonas sp.]HWH87702.1 PLD nuclease N-terminal domain-containing protein [Pseudomonas sp.]